MLPCNHHEGNVIHVTMSACNRYGQTKPCFVYRFITHGTMEEQIYNRQVTKQARALKQP